MPGPEPGVSSAGIGSFMDAIILVKTGLENLGIFLQQKTPKLGSIDAGGLMTGGPRSLDAGGFGSGPTVNTLNDSRSVKIEVFNQVNIDDLMRQIGSAVARGGMTGEAV